jgi:hypothetical protein
MDKTNAVQLMKKAQNNYFFLNYSTTDDPKDEPDIQYRVKSGLKLLEEVFGKRRIKEPQPALAVKIKPC